MEPIRQVRSKFRRKIVQKCKGRKSTLKPGDVGVLGGGGLKVSPGEMYRSLPVPRSIPFLVHSLSPLAFSSQLSWNARMLTSFPPHFKVCVWGGGGGGRDYTGFVGVGNFLAAVLPVGLASLCTLDKASPVHAAVVLLVSGAFDPFASLRF